MSVFKCFLELRDLIQLLTVNTIKWCSKPRAIWTITEAYKFCVYKRSRLKFGNSKTDVVPAIYLSGRSWYFSFFPLLRTRGRPGCTANKPCRTTFWCNLVAIGNYPCAIGKTRSLSEITPYFAPFEAGAIGDYPSHNLLACQREIEVVVLNLRQTETDLATELFCVLVLMKYIKSSFFVTNQEQAAILLSYTTPEYVSTTWYLPWR